MNHSPTLIPPIYGLVLTGGKSSRMGTDKGSLIYHKKPQREHVADLLQLYCKKVFISVKSEQNFSSDYKIIQDKYRLNSPLNAILSAFDTFPNVHWLVVACDMPLISNHTIEKLMLGMDSKTIATAYENHTDGLPEPLITLYHTSARLLLLDFYKKGQKSPRRFLLKNDITLLKTKSELELFNANSPVEMQKIIGMLKNLKS